MTIQGKFDFGNSDTGYARVYVSEEGMNTLTFSGSCPAKFYQAVGNGENFDIELSIPLQNLKISEENKSLVVEYRKQHLK